MDKPISRFCVRPANKTAVILFRTFEMEKNAASLFAIRGALEFLCLRSVLVFNRSIVLHIQPQVEKDGFLIVSRT